MIGHNPNAARHRAVVRAIDAGAHTVSALCAQTQHQRKDIESTMRYLRSVGIAETSSRPTAAGDEARYRLLVPASVALGRLPLDTPSKPTFDALDAALGMPPGVRSILSHPGRPRTVDRQWSSEA